MKVPSFQHARDDRSDQAMTPMIDVVFLLLIFFVLASIGQVKEVTKSIDTSKGSVETNQALPDDPEDPWVERIWLKVRRNIARNGVTVEMNGNSFNDLDPLRAALNQLGELTPESDVVLDIGGDVPVQGVIHVDDACRAAGFESISYGMLKPDEPRNKTD